MSKTRILVKGSKMATLGNKALAIEEVDGTLVGEEYTPHSTNEIPSIATMEKVMQGGGGSDEPTLLWENGNPYADFEEQILSFNFNQYEYLIIAYMNTSSSSKNVNYQKVKLNDIASVVEVRIFYFDSYGIYRVMFFNKSTNTVDIRKSYVFQTYAYGTTKQDAYFIIPVAIYGTNTL